MRTKIMSDKIVRQINAWFPAILWAALIFHFSSGTVPVASTVYWQNFAVEKTGHVLLFGALAILIYRGLRMNKVDRKKAAIWAVILATFYGGIDEFHQMFTQGREARVRDVFIDCGGATLVILVAYCLPPKLSKKMYALIEKFDLT
jgi:VanZ family protein